MKAYVFLIRRTQDEKSFPDGWPTVYTDRVLAEKAFGRVSVIVEVEVSPIVCSTCNDTGTVDESLGGEPTSNREAPCPDC